jgi:DNA-binding MarR family transcriptional regulator
LPRQVLIGQAYPALTAWLRLFRSHSATRRALDADLQAQHGLTVTDYEALLLLSKAEKPLRRVDLAEGLALTPSGITRLLDGLEAGGLVTKSDCSEDARVTYTVLTDAGRERLTNASCSHIAAVRELFEGRFTHDELETLAELLGRLPGAGGDASECSP